MQSSRRYMIPLILLATLLLAVPSSASAFCPICTVAVAGGVGLSRWLGIDDTISGLWIGAFVVAVSMWTVNWLRSRGVKFWGVDALAFLIYAAAVALPLGWKDVIGHPANKLWGVDKLILGMAIGALIFYVFAMLYFALKKRNNGRAHFAFQKIAMTIGALLVSSGIFYWITR